MALGAASADAQPGVKQVLVLQSFDRGLLVVDYFTTRFRIGLDEHGEPVNVVQIVVGPRGLVAAPEQDVVDYVRALFAGRPAPDLIVTIAGPAAAFARRHRQQLFPETPLLFASVDQRWIDDAPLADHEAAVAVAHDFPHLVDSILQVLPETQQIFLIVGSGPLGRFWRPQLESQFTRFRDRVTFVWSDEMTLPEIVRRCASLPSHSAILYFSFGSDAQGRAYPDEEVLAAIHATANAPLFGPQSPQLGHGVVGGAMMSIDDLARNTADVASRILHGEAPASVRVPAQSPGQPIFDWRELRRWGIPESRLPAGSMVMFRRPSLWSAYRTPVLTAVGALVLQSLLITWLLYERRARHRAEIESRRNLALAADANRRETMSALTTSIGHELGQPLSAVMHNTRALQMMVTASPVAPDAMGEILADIQSEAVLATQIIDRHRTMLRSRELEKKPIDLDSVIGETLALLSHDLRARRVETTLDLFSTPCLVDADPVLLQQVLVNLIRNAMDAVSETPSGRRQISIRTVVRATDVDISVSDTGIGLPAEIIDTLFTPFVTTKSHGLGVGLTIARKIVDAHGGTIAAQVNRDGGATFTVTLPCSATPRALSKPSGAADTA